ncbi:MAG TPA: terminase family protein [Allosphingosinicella sp.]|nr:terminase family protein [Allosphingosinicella sp.]
MNAPFPSPIYFKSRFAPGAPPLSRDECVEMLVILRRLTPELRRHVLQGLPDAAVRALAEEWWWQAHGGQIEPACAPNGEPWRIWSIVAARGFGKTRAGAEWIWARARENEDARIALVAVSIEEAIKVMIKGESGLLALARCDEKPRWIAGHGTFYFPSGAMAYPYGAVQPESLRGPQHHFAWCDELAKWPHADETFNNLMLGLRLGERPRTIVTTTPRPVPLLRRILALRRCVPTHGRTDENPHLPADFIEAMDDLFAGTRLARQELEGLLLDEFEGALWSRDLLEKARDSHFHARSADWMHGGSESDCPILHRIVIGLDPPASTGGNSCGILVCGRDEEGVAWVLADLTAHGLSPEAWARRVAEAAAQYGASRVVAEKNQGGDMIASVLRAVDADLPIRLVAATRSKAARAEPIALRFETGRARLAGHFPELEDQLCALTWSGYQGAGSPDRADAMVWAMTELFEKDRAEPRIRRL